MRVCVVTTAFPPRPGDGEGAFDDIDSEMHWRMPDSGSTHSSRIQEKGIDHPETVAELRRRGIGYVYIGQQQGRVNYQGPGVLDPEMLRNSSPYRLVYHQDRVWVFEARW